MKKIFIVFLIFIVSTVLMFSQATSGKVKMKGIVLDKETGNPIEGVKIMLYSIKAQSKHKITPVTDSDGKWRSLYMRSGKWYIDFSKVGYAPRKIAVDYVFRGAKYICFFQGEKYESLKIEMQKIQGPALEQSIIKEIEEGNALLVENKVKKAIKRFEKIIEKYKEREGIAIVNLYMGNCYSKLEEYEKAIEYFQKAIVKYPKHKELILSVGNSYSNLKQTDKAMEWFKKLSDEDITNPDTLYNIGINFYNAMDYKRAVSYFSRAVEMKENFGEAYYQLGMTYVALNKITESVTALKKFMEISPESPNFTTADEIVKAFSNQ